MNRYVTSLANRTMQFKITMKHCIIIGRFVIVKTGTEKKGEEENTTYYKRYEEMDCW